MNRDFKGVWIPREIWLCQELSFIEKCLLIEIDSLDNEDHCFASNEYLAKFLSCSPTSISKGISKLKKMNLIRLENFDGRTRQIRSNLKTALQNLQGSVLKIETEPGKKDEYNNKGNNKNNKTNIKVAPLAPPTTPPPIVDSTEKKEGNPIYKKFLEVYDTWYKERSDGVPPKIDGANGNSAKTLIGYFKTIVKARALADKVVLDENSENEKILESWDLVLKNWDSIEPFYQDKTRLIDINSNIQNIINQVKNGYRAKQQSGKGSKIESGHVRTMFDKVDSAFRGQ